MTRWGGFTFRDPVTDDVYTFGIGANRAGVPNATKAQAYLYSDYDGAPVIADTYLTGETISLSGTLLDEAQSVAFDEWAVKPYPVEYTDYLDRKWLVVIESIEQGRVRSARVWRHDWSMQLRVVGPVDDGPTPIVITDGAILT